MNLITGFITLFLLFPILHISAQDINGIKAKLVSSESVVENPPFAECHASSIVELPGKKLMATWFAGPFESNPQVGIWLAVKDENKWQKPYIIADGVINDSLRFACWNPVLFLTKKGRLFLFYKVGISPREWYGMMKYSDNYGKSWSEPEKLPGKMLGPIKNKPVQLGEGDILYPSSIEIMDHNNKWDIHVERSDADGRNWKIIKIDCDTFGVIQPTILRYRDNRIQLLSRSRQKYIVETWSTDQGNSWSHLTKTDLPNPNSGIDAVTLKNGMQLLIYNPQSRGRNRLSVAISFDGIKWKDVYKLEDQSSGEYSYPAVIQAEDGSVHITYTFNRKNIKHVVLNIEKD